MRNLKLFAFGAAAGFASASLGLGGGVVLVPGLVLLFGYDMKKAIGTSLATAVSAAFLGTITYLFIQSANTRVLIALFIIAGSLFGANFGARLANSMSSKGLKVLFSALFLFAGLKLTGIIDFPTRAVSEFSAYPLLIILGLAAGFASALFGIGGGVIMVPVLHLFFGLSMHEAIPTSLFVILPTTFTGCILHRKFNNIDTGAIKFLIPASLAGAVLGAAVSSNMPQHALKIIFGIVMILCAVRFFLGNKKTA